MTILQSWDSLRYFLALYRHKRLQVAGRSLNVDHTTVSRRVKELELMLNTKLFEKGGNGFQITLAGKNLLPHAENIEKTILGIEQISSADEDDIKGIVRIGSPEHFGSYFLSSQLASLLKCHEKVKFDLIFDNKNIDLSKRDVDIFITTERPTSGRLVVNRLAEYNTCLFGTKAYIDNNPEINSVNDLSGHKLIGTYDNKTIRDAIKNTSLSHCKVVNFKSHSFMSTYKAMQNGIGLCLLPEFMEREYDDLICVLSDKVKINQTLWLVVHEDVRHISTIKKISRFISDSVSEKFV